MARVSCLQNFNVSQQVLSKIVGVREDDDGDDDGDDDDDDDGDDDGDG